MRRYRGRQGKDAVISGPRPHRWAVLPLAALVAVAGCGSGDQRGAASSSAPRSTATSSHPTPGQRVDVDALVARMNAATLRSKYVSLAMTSATATGSMKMHMVSVDRTDVLIATSAEQILSVDRTVYLKGSGDRSWRRIDATTLAPEAVSLRTALLQHGQHAPTVPADSWRGAVATYRGKDATGARYQLDVPLRSLLTTTLRLRTDLTPAAREALTIERRNAGNRTVRQDVWLDPQGRLAKVRYDAAAMTGAGGTTASPAPLTATYSGWGVPIAMSAPPADQVRPY